MLKIITKSSKYNKAPYWLVIWLTYSLLVMSSLNHTFAATQDFSIKTLAGDTFSLSSYKNKKPVYLFFWATWCPICKKEIPRVNALHQEFGDQIKVLAINVGYDDSLANIKQYQQQYPTLFPIAFDENSIISSSYGVIGTPTQIVIDIDGELRYQGNRFPPGLENLLPILNTPKEAKAPSKIEAASTN
jgi:thiol-disulfide isomerase/thioredoxin